MKKLLMIVLVAVSLTASAQYYATTVTTPTVTYVQSAPTVVTAPPVVSTTYMTTPAVVVGSRPVWTGYGCGPAWNTPGYSPPPIPYHISAQWGNTGPWPIQSGGPVHYGSYHYSGGYRPSLHYHSGPRPGGFSGRPGGFHGGRHHGGHYRR